MKKFMAIFCAIVCFHCEGGKRKEQCAVPPQIIETEKFQSSKIKFINSSMTDILTVVMFEYAFTVNPNVSTNSYIIELVKGNFKISSNEKGVMLDKIDFDFSQNWQEFFSLSEQFIPSNEKCYSIDLISKKGKEISCSE